jgi:DNA-binding PadR family transcriptional regulator
MMKLMKPTPTQLFVLLRLRDTQCAVNDRAQLIQSSSGERAYIIWHGGGTAQLVAVLVTTLNKLAGYGFIERSKTKSDGNQVWQLTEAGRQAISFVTTGSNISVSQLLAMSVKCDEGESQVEGEREVAAEVEGEQGGKQIMDENDENYGIPPGGLEALADEDDARVREYLDSLGTTIEEQEYGLPSCQRPPGKPGGLQLTLRSLR